MNQEEQWLLKEKYSGEKSEAFFTDAALLKSGTPLAYLIGWVPFLNCRIYLSNNSELVPPIPSSRRHQEFLSGDRTRIKAKQFALIPRPETEYWVEKAIAAIKNTKTEKPHILDLCAGSGAIGIAVLKHIPNAHVTFGEIDPTHLPTIGKNLKANDIACTRYHVFQSDLFKKINGTFDVILTNPPYIDPALDRTETSVKMHEPHVALYGGIEGVECIKNIIKSAPTHLHQNGQLWIEHEPEQTTTIHAFAAENGFSATTHKDQYDIERFSILMLQ